MIFVALLWTRSKTSMSFLCWGLQNWMQYSRWGLTGAEQRSRTTSLNMLATLILMQPRIRLAFWAASARCQLMLNFSSTSTHKSFSSGLLSSHSLPSLYLRLVLKKNLTKRCCFQGTLKCPRFVTTFTTYLLVDVIYGKHIPTLEMVHPLLVTTLHATRQ